MFGGFYSVPLYALIQSRSQPTHRARIIAANNILNSLFMIVSALMAMALTRGGLSAFRRMFLVDGAAECRRRDVHLFARARVFAALRRVDAGAHVLPHPPRATPSAFPKQGAAVLVCNHVSFVDAIVIMAESPRPIRFVMDHRIFRTPFVGWLFRHAKAIPIAPAHEDAEAAGASLRRAARRALADGELVCIFPEGKLTRTGEINPFSHGITEILGRQPAPVVPMALRGLWGSVFSRHEDTRWPRPIQRGVMSRLTLAVGEPIDPADATPEHLQKVVSALRGARK